MLVVNIREHRVRFYNPARKKRAKQPRLAAAHCFRYPKRSSRHSQSARSSLRYERSVFKAIEVDVGNVPEEYGRGCDNEGDIQGLEGRLLPSETRGRDSEKTGGESIQKRSFGREDRT